MCGRGPSFCRCCGLALMFRVINVLFIRSQSPAYRNTMFFSVCAILDRDLACLLCASDTFCLLCSLEEWNLQGPLLFAHVIFVFFVCTSGKIFTLFHVFRQIIMLYTLLLGNSLYKLIFLRSLLIPFILFIKTIY